MERGRKIERRTVIIDRRALRSALKGWRPSCRIGPQAGAIHQATDGRIALEWADPGHAGLKAEKIAEE